MDNFFPLVLINSPQVKQKTSVDACNFLKPYLSWMNSWIVMGKNSMTEGISTIEKTSLLASVLGNRQ